MELKGEGVERGWSGGGEKGAGEGEGRRDGGSRVGEGEGGRMG